MTRFIQLTLWKSDTSYDSQPASLGYRKPKPLHGTKVYVNPEWITSIQAMEGTVIRTPEDRQLTWGKRSTEAYTFVALGVGMHEGVDTHYVQETPEDILGMIERLGL